MFLGQYSAQLSVGSRVSLPKKIREQITGSEIVLSKGFDGCIFGFNKNTWESVSEEELITPITSSEGRKIRRQLFAAAEVVVQDEQGRCVISQSLREYAHLSKSISIIGAGDHFELWDYDTWEKYSKSL
jgi:MraZ protein